MNIILTMSSFIFPLITFPYISRVLLPEGTGKVNFAISLISYFSMFAQLGIPTYGIRVCAKVRDNKEKLSKTVHELFIINLITTLITYIALFASLQYVPKLQQEKFLYVVISLRIILTTIGVEWLYKALEQYSYITIRSLIFKFVSVFLMFMLVKSDNDYIIYGMITVVASSLSYIFNILNIKKFVFIKLYSNYEFRKHFKPIFVFFAMSCATTVYTNLDNIMLGFLTTDIDVGFYSAAVKIKGILVSIVTSLGAVLLPRASYYVENNMMDKFFMIGKKAINFVFLIATPLMIYFTMFAKEGILFLSGTEFYGSIIPMQVIMPTVLLIGISNILAIQILIPLGLEKKVLYAECAGAFADLIINFLLIPTYGASGAAFGTLVAELVVTIWCYMEVKRNKIRVFSSIKYRIIILALVMGCIASVGIKNVNCSYFFSLLLSSTLFFGIYFLIMIIFKEQLTIEICKQMINKFKRK